MTALLPLDSWRKIIGYHPFHFWGLADSANTPTSACNDLVTKYSYQATDAAGREDILQAIEAAEAKLKDYLHWSVAPHWVVETLQYPRFYQTGMDVIVSRAIDGRWQTVNANEGKIQAVGVETLTLIGTAAVVYSDADGDGLNDTFVATTVATTTEPHTDDIGAYFGSVDRLDGKAASDDSEIKPVTKTINGNGTVTIRGRAWLLVRPILYEGVTATPSNPIDPTVAGNFVTSIEVYRHYTNPDGITVDDSQATLVWETRAFPNVQSCCGGSATVFGNNSLDPAAQAFVVARAGIRDAEIGQLNPAAASFNSTTGVWASVAWDLCAPPDRVIVRYKAGRPLVSGEMDRQMQIVVARLACSELATRPTACDQANRELYKYQFDMSRAGGNNDEQFRISNDDLNNPIGTMRGQVQAWKFIKENANMQGFNV